jgi:ABC-type Fe3+ transport system substrate-binding protein
MLRQRWPWLLAMLALAVACTPATTPPPATRAPATSPTTAPASAAAAAESPAPAASVAGLRADPAAWERLQATGRQEGSVVVVGPGFPGLREGVVEGFRRAHGINVEYLGLPSGEVNARVEREAAAGRPSIDVNIGGVSACWLLGEQGLIDEVTPLAVAPDVVEPTAWKNGGPRLIKPSPNMPRDFHCGLQLAEWVMTDLFVNPQIVPPAAIQSWKDLLKPEYRGKIAAFDPRRPGPGQPPAAYLYTLFGEQYITDLFLGQQVTLSSDNRQLAEWVARGTYPIGIALVQAAVEPLRAAGLPIERVFPADGPGTLVGGFGTVMRIKNSPHPNAAAVFVNWFASRDGQEMWEREMLEVSMRTDVPHTAAPEYIWPRPGVSYLDDYDPDYYFRQRVPAVARIQELFGR